MPVEHHSLRSGRPPSAWRLVPLAAALLVTALLGACETPPPVSTAAAQPTSSPPAPSAPVAPVVDAVASSTPDTPLKPPAGEPSHPMAIDLEAPSPLAPLLNYADRLRALSSTEQVKEVAALGEPGNDPVRQFQLALALTYSRQPVDTARAMGLLQRVINHPDPASNPLKPWRGCSPAACKTSGDWKTRWNARRNNCVRANAVPRP
ncbi:MAG: hypothetical protein R3E42_06110 [Burkholderiaceae bacterium]